VAGGVGKGVLRGIGKYHTWKLTPGPSFEFGKSRVQGIGAKWSKFSSSSKVTFF
jgi:hypothetical protein